MAELLRIEGLKQYYLTGKGVFKKGYVIKAVDDVSFSLEQGQTLGLVGESGCGKSTLGRTILKLYEPTEGKIFFEGKEITHLNSKQMRPLRREMQIVFQDPLESLNQRHTVGGILEEPYKIHGIGTPAERKRWVLELLDKIGLPHTAVNRYPHEFSGGQRQRIGIARAIALKPKLLICDESVSALDVSVQAQILNLLLKIQKEMNLSIIFISHDLSVVKHISDHVAVMKKGKVVEMGTAKEVYSSPKNEYTKELLSAIPITHPSQRIKNTSQVANNY
ncbi:murein tripeptide ABC transporter/oligopeptide ABC transporter ATP binding subunit OppF [Vibrio harveyi]|nr:MULTISPECIES: ATP-binding cassette domain-containing protein [Vibrio]APP07924.1 ABC transporter ATP-binding protein [Vibrio harveyi]EKO3782143.1 ABC transporter ATP-binding protein [Vibrio harveyi]EKO3822476.1 ABC transporter ATP-binding protein [Vibrio harveyi]EKO3829696.1 ABC transporter ATP-binding protein [Vibrio harveyi]EKY4193542.1 ABC transporter ATP-binding protein [Vibrio harveyi]